MQVRLNTGLAVARGYDYRDGRRRRRWYKRLALRWRQWRHGPTGTARCAYVTLQPLDSWEKVTHWACLVRSTARMHSRGLCRRGEMVRMLCV